MATSWSWVWLNSRSLIFTKLCQQHNVLKDHQARRLSLDQLMVWTTWWTWPEKSGKFVLINCRPEARSGQNTIRNWRSGRPRMRTNACNFKVAIVCATGVKWKPRNDCVLSSISVMRKTITLPKVTHKLKNNNNNHHKTKNKNNLLLGINVCS